MNPTIEVQITAKLDRLDAALKVAEAKIGSSAVTMGKTGDQAGSMFVDKLVGNMAKGLTMAGITTVLGNGISVALQGINAGKKGEEIGTDIAKGIVDGAKSIPVVGIIVSIFDELVNGSTRQIEKLNEQVAKAVEKYISSMQAMTQATKDFKKTTQEKVEDLAVQDSPSDAAALALKRENEKADADAQALKELGQQALREKRKLLAAQDAANLAKMEDEGVTGDIGRAFAGKISRDQEIVENKKKSESEMRQAEEAVAKSDAEIDAALADRKLANTRANNKKLVELTEQLYEELLQTNAKYIAEQNSLYEKKLKTAMDTGDFQSAQKLINDKAAADQKALDEKNATIEMSAIDLANATKEISNKAAEDQKALDEKSATSAMEMGNQMVADFKEQEQEKYDAAMKAQQDIIDANTAAQAKISKVGRLNKMANEAARSMIQSGQTALGQFNFATDGASNKAMAIAQKQLTSIEKIEAATAEQVRLTKESAGFR